MKGIKLSLALLTSVVMAGEGHELSVLFENTFTGFDGKETSVEYCRAGACEVFTLKGRNSLDSLQDYALAYLIGVSKIAAPPKNILDGSPSIVQSFLRRYRSLCPQKVVRDAARCVVEKLGKQHDIRISSVNRSAGVTDAPTPTKKLTASGSSERPFDLAKFSDYEQNFMQFVTGGALESAALYESRISDPTFNGFGLLGAILHLNSPHGDGPCPWTRGLVYALDWDERHDGASRIAEALRAPTRAPSLYYRRGETVISMCALGPSVHEAVRLALLKNAGADVDQELPDTNRTPPLHLAVVLRNSLRADQDIASPIVSRLLYQGSNPDVRDGLGKTALMVLVNEAETFNEAAADILVSAGADVNAIDNGGQPVIGYILHPSRERQKEFQLRKMEFLIAHGANSNMRIVRYHEADGGGGFERQNTTLLDAILASGDVEYYKAAKKIVDTTAVVAPPRSDRMQEDRARGNLLRKVLAGTWERGGRLSLASAFSGKDKLTVAETGAGSYELYGNKIEGWTATYSNILYFASFTGKNDFYCKVMERPEGNRLKMDCSDQGRETWEKVAVR